MKEMLTRRGALASIAGLAAVGGLTGITASSFGATPVAIRVAAASDLKFALTALVKSFTEVTGVQVELQFGSSGNFAQQIQQGLPLDLFLSADEGYVSSLAQAGLTQDRGVLYATGRLALILPKNSALQLPKSELEAKLSLPAQLQTIRKFAIANPEHAPYGRAAKEALQNLSLWESLQTKLVLGDNISQATQFVTSGAAQAGITALSLALAPEVAAQLASQDGGYWLIPTHLHTPLKQRMVLLKSAQATAKTLFDYLQKPAARHVLAKYGFTI